MSHAMDSITGFQLTVSVNRNRLVCHRLNTPGGALNFPVT